MNPIVFQHDVTSSYPPEELKDLPGVPTYAARVLASTRANGAVILPVETQSHYGWVRDHYDYIGLESANTVVFGGYADLERFPEHELSVFYFGQPAHAARPNEAWWKTVEFLNSKNNFLRLCQTLGVSAPRTVCIEDPSSGVGNLVGFDDVLPVYVKVSLSASGFGVKRCETRAEFDAFTSRLMVPYQVQEALPAGTQFLNVQYEVVSGLLVPGPITVQILEGNSHSGNVYPVSYDEAAIRATTNPLATWAIEHGMRGVFAFDVAVTGDGRILPIECNPRWNGASYYSRVAEKLGVTAWESRNVPFRARSFDGVGLGELTFCRGRSEGVIVVNWGCVGDGKVGLFIAGEAPARAEYLADFKARFS